MDIQISDPLFRDAVSAIDRGDKDKLTQLLDAHPRLLTDRLSTPEDGYFKEPYLLWFVAENPIRNDRLPENIVDVTSLIIVRAKALGVPSLPDQINYTLALVSSGKVSREHHLQEPLIDLLIEQGGNPTGAIHAALHHQEVDALKRLVHHGAKVTLPVAIALRENELIRTLINTSSRTELQVALTAAAFYGNADALKELVKLNLDVNAWNDEGFHAHSTPLHQAVLSGSVDSVRILIDAGANIMLKDKEYNGTALGWAIYCHQTAVEQFLREHIAGTIVKKLVDEGIINPSEASRAIRLIASEIVA